jgi:predicted permease
MALVLSLALGVGANTAVFSVLKASLQGHVAWQDPDRLVMVGRLDSETPLLGEGLPVSWPRLQHWREQHAGLDALDGFAWNNLRLLGMGAPRTLAGLRVTDGFFQTLGGRPLLGRLLQKGDAEVAVLSNQAWQDWFQGDRQVVGRSLDLGGRSVIVVGVLPRGATWGDTEVFLPLRVTPEEETPGNNWINMVGRLPVGGTLQQTREALAVMSARLGPEDNPGRTVTAVPQSFQEYWFADFRASHKYLGLAALFILGLAGLNVAVLLLGRGTARAGELGLREALGARKIHLYLPLLTEALLAAVPGILLAFLLARWSQDLLAGFVPGGLQEFHGTGWAELAFAAVLALGVVTLGAVVPALLVAGVKAGPGSASGCSTSKPRRRWISHGLVAIQVACALALLSGFALIYTSLRQLHQIPPGMDGRRCVVARVDLDLPHDADARRAEAQVLDLIRRLGGLPGVASVSSTNLAPGLNGGWNGTVTVPGFGKPAFTWLRASTPGYFRAMGIPLQAGRDFTGTDLAQSADAVIVSESFARTYFPGQDALGRLIQRGGDRRIVGIVGDVAISSLGQDRNRQTLYLPGPLLGTHLDLVVEATGAAAPLVPIVRRVLQETWPMLPLGRIAPLPALIDLTLRGRSREVMLYGLLAALALAITAAGLFGVLSRDVQERRREMGVRMALGASPGRILAMILRQGLAVVGVGVLLGLAGSAGMAILLRDSLGRTRPEDPGSHLLAIGMLLTTALLAILVPALNAARQHPMGALRRD